MEAVVVVNQQRELSPQEAARLLLHPDQEKISYVPPAQPKEGAVYLYSPGENIAKKGMCITAAFIHAELHLMTADE